MSDSYSISDSICLCLQQIVRYQLFFSEDSLRFSLYMAESTNNILKYSHHLW